MMGVLELKKTPNFNIFEQFELLKSEVHCKLMLQIEQFKKNQVWP